MKPSRLLIIPALLSLLAGCASESRLTVAPTRNIGFFAQTFGQAYASQDEAGDYRILLLNDGLAGTPPAGPLHPAAQPLVRQVVRIRLFWRPMLGSRPNFPSSSNAAIDWYVMGVGSRESIDMIHYRGVGFVSVHSASGGVSVTIKHTLLQPVACCGRMTDPFGDARLSGNFFASMNPEQLQTLWDQTLRSAQTAMNRANLPAEASAALR